MKIFLNTLQRLFFGLDVIPLTLRLTDSQGKIFQIGYKICSADYTPPLRIGYIINEHFFDENENATKGIWQK